MKKIFTLLIVSLVIFASSPTFSQGCMEPSDDEGATIIGFLQPQYDYKFLGKDGDGYSLDQSSFRFNRARIGIMGSIPYDVSYYFLVETSGFFTGNPFLLDAFVTYKGLGKWATLSMGSFKSPVSLELFTACHKLHTIERSLVVNELTSPQRDIGLMLNGTSDSLTIFGAKTFKLFRYSLALTNGTGLNQLDNNLGKNYSGRLVITPWKHLSFGGSYLWGKQKPQSEDALKDDEKMRYGAELEVRYKDFLLQGEYLFGEDIGSYTTGGGCGEPVEVHEGSIQRNGFYVMAMYMTPWRLQPVIKFEVYDPNISTDYVENPDAKDDKKTIMTYGLNYFLNDWTRIQVNYLYKAEATYDKEIPNDCLLVQLQVVF